MHTNYVISIGCKSYLYTCRFHPLYLRKCDSNKGFHYEPVPHVTMYLRDRVLFFRMTSEAEAVRKFFENVPRSDDPSQWSEITEEKITADQALLHDAAQIIVTAYKELRANGQIPRK